jgi:hypothetical protein
VGGGCERAPARRFPTRGIGPALISPTGFLPFVILPGLISAAFYRRRPSLLQVALGLAFTIGLSGFLGYIQDMGTSRVWENVVVAILGGVVLYLVILAYLIYRYLPRHAKVPGPVPTNASPRE